MILQKFPKGRYYVGDPCYIFKDSWDSILNETHYFENEVQKIGDTRVFCFHTAHGDGTYYDNYGRKYWVDAGLIGILPIELLKIDSVYTESEIEESEGMNIVEFDEDFFAGHDNGVFNFSHIVIDTTGEYENED